MTKTMITGEKPNLVILAIAVMVILGVGVSGILTILHSIEEKRETTLGYMAPIVSTAKCPKIGEQFSVLVRGANAEAATDGHLLKLIKIEPAGGQTKLTFMPLAEGQVKIYLASPGYRPETIEKRISRFDEDAWAVTDDAERSISIARSFWLKGDEYNQLWFDSRPFGESFPILVSELTGNSNDKEPPVWTTSPNMKVIAERTKGSELLSMGRTGYRFSSRVSITRTAPGSGWLRVSWKDLSRTITIPDPHPTH